MKKLTVISVLSLLMIIEFYPIESNSQDLPEGKSYGVNQMNILSENENTGFSVPESIFKSDVTKIKFLILNEGKVNLDIFNTEGELIRSLADGYMEPGEYTVYFKTSDDMLPGMYNCKFQHNNTVIKKDIVLVK